MPADRFEFSPGRVVEVVLSNRAVLPRDGVEVRGPVEFVLGDLDFNALMYSRREEA